MSTFRLHINTDGAAFGHDDGGEHSGPELARILRELADVCEHGGDALPWSYANLRDANGNTCGAYRLRDEDES